ncbi:TonB-dependent receptor [Vibrio nitrifigilis]|uniref:TonB-dependent siderophore receptor n=1 Tax=Vibrio nitrifigilis TaxID=2789781 RepID=A0ABS0GE62_9VIBR|nr:TonB-dependent siderophore receptor [Vibrio nitrifigilis]MBF9000699.1 TonB-dependent siderophore receptor [Vibrio nitrifigilis]
MKKIQRNNLAAIIGALCLGNIVSMPSLANDQVTTSQSHSSSSKRKPSTKSTVNADNTVVVYGENETQTEFRPDVLTVDPLGELALSDLPYSAAVMNSAFLKDRHVKGLFDALKYDSSTQMEARGGVDVGRPQSRGVEGSVVANSHLDGMNVVVTTAQPMELYERLEIIHSLTGALYGPATPAGDFNYEFKRPTLDYLNDVSIGLDSNGAREATVDLGGTPNQYMGYRINVIKEQGDGYVSGSQIDRKAVGAAFDLHPTDKTTIELNASYYRYKKYGYPGGFYYSSSTGLPSALDATKKGYGQSFAGSDLKTTTGSFKLKHDINDNWKAEVGILGQKVDRLLMSVTNKLNSDGTFTQTITTKKTARRFKLISNEARLNGHIDTGSVEHQVTIGTTGYTWNTYSIANSSGSKVTLGNNIDIDDPQTFSQPVFYTDGDIELNSKNITQSAILGDMIKWNEQWSTLLVGSYNHFDTLNVDSANYHDDGFSSTEALIFKPIPETTTYVAYSDTLEAGQVVDDDDYKNDGETLDPYRSRQIELGLKQDLGSLDASLAAFRIKRPLAYASSDSIYRVQGMQRNYGIETALNGNVTRQVKIMANATWLDATLTDSYSDSTEGKRVVGVPEWQANVLTEYDFDVVPGLSINANVHYVGKRAGNADNDVWMSAYTTLDLGAKYITKRFYNKPLTLSLSVDNVTNKRYWAASFPRSLYGDSSAGAMAFLGAPLQAHLTASMKF